MQLYVSAFVLYLLCKLLFFSSKMFLLLYVHSRGIWFFLPPFYQGSPLSLPLTFTCPLHLWGAWANTSQGCCLAGISDWKNPTPYFWTAAKEWTFHSPAVTLSLSLRSISSSRKMNCRRMSGYFGGQFILQHCLNSGTAGVAEVVNKIRDLYHYCVEAMELVFTCLDWSIMSLWGNWGESMRSLSS